ncbi:DUF512 domain-containing protein [bacterium]|nr:DUF512 domain-containing protein [bacterium]
MIIIRVDKPSPAADLSLQPGDQILEINGHPIQDEIDFQYYSADARLRLVIQRGARVFSRSLRRTWEGSFGVEFHGMKYRHCGNRCVFCFIDQNPGGLRRSLYFKDEDYRLSFLYGNYVTLTNVTRRDLVRIVEQRLSPIYVSIHAVDPEVRRRLLGIKHDDRLMEKIRFLTDQGIEVHAQIVLCPGYNDGLVLQDTLQRLYPFYPGLQSVAVVPLGLTRHRRGLTYLPPVSPLLARQTLRIIEKYAQGCKRDSDCYWVYAADEFYLRARAPIPPRARYEDFSQIENGVGMCRDLIDTVKRQTRYFPKRVHAKRITLVTGRSAEPLLRQHVLPPLQAVSGLQVNLQAVVNRFFGRRVTVSGLLTGQDIARQLKGAHNGDLLVLPPNCLNHDGLFLDDWTPQQLEQSLGVRVYQPSNFLQLVKVL